MAVTVVEEGEIKSSSNEKKKRDSKFVLTAGKFYGDADMPCCVTAVWTRPVCTETLPSSSSSTPISQSTYMLIFIYIFCEN